ncbi:MAG TPA: tripartite tricarboxylate transporter substrate binding protein [Burkholderiales bacterium]|jgi:tripartite-type tricarboxylate transporter receptor subunit TctC|nr:tripartite tricarboxylate transporter substrate binding protein [Burkholderiales bacterium]
MNCSRYLFVIAVAAGFSNGAWAQNYPSKPVRMVVPYPPGGGTDIIARPLAQRLTEGLGQQVIVDNRAGASGNLGMESVAKTPPDGYTIVLALNAQWAVNPSLYQKLPYDPVRDFAPITLLGAAPYLLVVHPTLPAKSIREFIALAKSKPNELRFSSSGNGSGAHLAAAMLDSMTGTKTTHIPYKGAGQAMPDLIAGQVQFSYVTYTAAGPFVRTGRLRALGVTSARRSAALPDLPAISEVVPGYDAQVWYGIAAPAGTPSDIITRLNGEAKRALNHPDMGQRLITEAFEPIGSTPEYLGNYIKSEIVRWGAIVKASGAQVD